LWGVWTVTQAFPLQWPVGWPRAQSRTHAPFKVPPLKAKVEMYAELHRLQAKDIIVSTDQPLNRDGSPSLARRSVDDPGVAVYFTRKGRSMVLACDQYDALHDNMRAIGKLSEWETSSQRENLDNSTSQTTQNKG
jgi:hypothetical protein